jgi:hypothetical protein
VKALIILIQRKLPDGTMQRPPEIMGCLTDTKSHRNFNVVRKDATGKILSYSLASTSQLTPTEYRVTMLFSILNDQIGGWDIVYDLSRKTQSVPVNVDGGRIQCKLPFDPLAVLFEEDKTTAAAEGRDMDVWEKCHQPRIGTLLCRTIGRFVTLAHGPMGAE